MTEIEQKSSVVTNPKPSSVDHKSLLLHKNVDGMISLTILKSRDGKENCSNKRTVQSVIVISSNWHVFADRFENLS
jgi:hypothetical protein